ncbi:WD domain, G-beta repeat-containing protein [Besnoitia besnoiti]|uniref:WD domain, G-beta repeat-containing protein n=1 Tax=Besnoitia besnoiti TaxID=94643 RepID=A0A2A9MCG7_BESBE|nr:WD domain, G-beta repeat-containing protein [Besnoitia besnoiti]PFH33090.1 WD domain, G-beta repeat-containing protein [Besnoitia besnoiti]
MSQAVGSTAPLPETSFSSPTVACRLLKGHRDSVVGLDIFCSPAASASPLCGSAHEKSDLLASCLAAAARSVASGSACDREDPEAEDEAAPSQGTRPRRQERGSQIEGSVAVSEATSGCRDGAYPCDGCCACPCPHSASECPHHCSPEGSQINSPPPVGSCQCGCLSSCCSPFPAAPSLLASSSDDGTVRLWDLRAEKAVACIRHPLFLSAAGAAEDSSSNLGAVKFHPETYRLLYVACGSRLLLFDLAAPGSAVWNGEQAARDTLETGSGVSNVVRTYSNSGRESAEGDSVKPEHPQSRPRGDDEAWSDAAAVWNLANYAQVVPSENRVKREADDEGSSDEDDDDPLTVNDFDLWCPSSQQLREMKFVASSSADQQPVLPSAGKQASRRGAPKKKKAPSARPGSSPEDVPSSADAAEASAAPSPVCFALPLDTGEVVVALHRAPLAAAELSGSTAGTVGSEGAAGLAPALQLQKDRFLCMHRSICGVARFRKDEQVPDLVTGGFDFNVSAWNLADAKPRGSLEVRRAIEDLRNHVMPWEKKPSQAKLAKGAGPGVQDKRDGGPENTKCLNPPFVVSLAMSPDSRRVAVGLGDGHLSVFDYANSSRNARLLPTPSWTSQPHSLSSAALSWVPSPSAVHRSAAAGVASCSGKKPSPVLCADVESVLVSCGNDRRLCVFREAPLASGEAAGRKKGREGSLQLLLQHRLPYKPNYMVCASSCSITGCACRHRAPAASCSAGATAATSRVASTEPATLRCYVGDVSNDIRVFEFPC